MRKVIVLLFLVLTIWQPASGATRRNSVLLFTVDSYRPDRFSLYGNSRRTTPNIDAWAKTAVVHDNAFSVAAWTAPGLVSILTGRYPWEHGVDSRDRYASESLPTLLKTFKGAGYAVPNLNFFTFVPYYSNLGLGPIEREYFTEQEGNELLNWLDGKASDGAFFFWYHTTTIHQPYNPSGAAPSDSDSPGITAVKKGAIVPRGSVKFTDSDRRVLLDLYDSEVENMDRFFGRMLEKLEEKRLLDENRPDPDSRSR